MDAEKLVQNIKKYCALKNIKPTVACRESGVGTSFINNIEARNQVPSVAKVQQLAIYLGVTTSELLGEELVIREAPSGSGEGTITEEDRALLSAYQQAAPELRAAVRRVLGLE